MWMERCQWEERVNVIVEAIVFRRMVRIRSRGPVVVYNALPCFCFCIVGPLTSLAYYLEKWYKNDKTVSFCRFWFWGTAKALSKEMCLCHFRYCATFQIQLVTEWRQRPPPTNYFVGEQEALSLPGVPFRNEQLPVKHSEVWRALLALQTNAIVRKHFN